MAGRPIWQGNEKGFIPHGERRNKVWTKTVTVICSVCGKDVERHPSNAARVDRLGGRHYCSKECSDSILQPRKERKRPYHREWRTYGDHKQVDKERQAVKTYGDFGETALILKKLDKEIGKNNG